MDRRANGKKKISMRYYLAKIYINLSIFPVPVVFILGRKHGDLMVRNRS